MLDKPVDVAARANELRPAADFQSHLAALDAQGLLTRIDRAVNKDTELHPLVRWQFVGGIAEHERRAFLFTNVVDAKGRRYDMPVAVGALAASPDIYAVGMGQPVAAIGPAWMRAIANPIAPVVVTAAPCHEVVITGDELRQPAGGLARLPVPVSTPGFDSAPYLTATLCITRDPDFGDPEHGHLPGRPEGDRPAGGSHGGAARGRCRRLLSLAQIPRARRADADRDRDRLRARGGLHRPAEARAGLRRARRRRGARGRADPHRQGEDRRSHGAGRCRDRHRRDDRPRLGSSPRRRSAKATAMSRSRPSTCRCR